MMQTPIEIPITIVHHTKAGYIQIAPAQQFDRLPAARQLSPDLSFEPEWTTWQGSQANSVAQNNLRERLEEVGSRVYSLLPPKESLLSVLDLQGQGINSAAWRRILVYTDLVSSGIPIETMWSNERFEGQPIGFVAANPVIPVSIVRHLSLEATNPMAIEKGKPLRMLIVFSNPHDWDRLGKIISDDGHLDFTECLGDEKQALNEQLCGLVRLSLLEVHFLVGNERGRNNSVVYQGQVQLRESQLIWIVEAVHERDLRDLFLELLGREDWHVLHYFGHGAGNIDPELVLRPGQNLSCKDIGQQITQMPRLVIVNACESANPAGPSAPVLTGFATLFLLRGTVNLVCMQMNVTPKTATLTTQALYSRLSRSLLTRQMDFEEALYEVRRQVYDEADRRLDFFCPVLYTRPVNGPIFEYQDNRMDVWKVITGAKSLWNPITLIKAACGCSKLIKRKRT